MICTVKGCENAAIARGLCAMHYMRARRTGNAITVGKPGRPPVPGGHAEMVAQLRAENLDLRRRLRAAQARIRTLETD